MGTCGMSPLTALTLEEKECNLLFLCRLHRQQQQQQHVCLPNKPTLYSDWLAEFSIPDRFSFCTMKAITDEVVDRKTRINIVNPLGVYMWQHTMYPKSHVRNLLLLFDLLFKK